MSALALRSASPLAPTPRDQARILFAELQRWLGRDETLLLPLHVVEVEQERRAREIMRLLLQGQVSGVIQGMKQSATKRGLSKAERGAIDDARRYFRRNRQRMRYHEYLAQGLPIASGAVEGACKNLIKDRMERAGMRWTIEGAEAMVRLRAVYVSGDFDAYWEFHGQREQSRLYPEGRWWVVGE